MNNARDAVGDLVAVLPQDAPPWYKQSHLIKLNYCLFTLILFASASGYDASMMNGLQSLNKWQEFMHHPTGPWLGWLNAIYWVGSGLVFPVAAMATNKYGRKPIIWAAYFTLTVGTILQTAANNQVAFMFGRLFIGFTNALFAISTPLLINEIAYPTHRGIVNALFSCGWYIGGVLSAWVAYGTRNYTSSWGWRIPSLLQCAIPLVAIPGFLITPESPRWLISQERHEEALKILSDFHAGGRVSDPLVNYEVIEITETIRAEKAAEVGGSYMDMLKTAGNRHRLFISISLGFYAQWVGNGVVSYYLSLVLDTVGVTSVTDQTLINGFLQVWNLLVASWSSFYVDRFGRRPLFIASAIIMIVSYIIVTALSATFDRTLNAATGIAVIPFLFVFYFGYDVALTPFLTSYPCEIWPFNMRSRGLTVMWISTMFGNFFNTFVNPIALGKIGWRYYIVFIVVLLCYGVTCFLYYPETKGYSLEQIAVVFDGDDANVATTAETVAKSLGKLDDSEKDATKVSVDEKV